MNLNDKIDTLVTDMSTIKERLAHIEGRIQGDLVGANHGRGSLVQGLQVDQGRMRRLLRDARGEFFGIGMLLEGFGYPLALPDFLIQYVGKV